ncbi:MAG: glycosyltransferase family 2 protein [Acidimicrobiales bacterium]
MSTPAVTAVISTHHRPGPLREAIAAIRDQDLDAPIETIVVFDKEDPDPSIESDDGHRPVRAVPNHRTSGLPGSRNSGVDLATAPVVGFCDDDDLWKPAKARLQLELMERTGAPTVGCSIEVTTPERRMPRESTGTAARIEDLVRSRIPEAYMGTVLVRRDTFLDDIGPVAEDIPGGFAEDYDWWIRAARHAPVPLVTEPMFQLRWEGQSYFRDKWQNMLDALTYLLDRYPEFREDRKGYARVLGQQAFATAALGHRADAWRIIAEATRNNPTEPRLPFAAAVASGVPANNVMAWLNKRGRGI